MLFLLTATPPWLIIEVYFFTYLSYDTAKH